MVMDRLDYDPETGKFTWKGNFAPRAKKGEVAGTKDKNGYIQINTLGKFYKAHRLAWTFFHGVEPDGEVDHINGDPSDNRIDNLRVVSRQQNAQSMSIFSTNKSGFTGVFRNKLTGNWIARIFHEGKCVHIGTFSTPEKGHQAYLEMRSKLKTFQPELRENHSEGSKLTKYYEKDE